MAVVLSRWQGRAVLESDKENMVHLIYLHQGHAAYPAYLTVLATTMATLLDGESWMAQANPYRTSTIWGIDAAVDRVIEELIVLLKSRPEVTALSLVGVSLGGVILERAIQRLSRLGDPKGEHEPINVELRYFIAFASPLNGLASGWTVATIVATMLGWFTTTLSDLLAMHNKQRESVTALASFKKCICLNNLKGDWRVPLASSLPVGGDCRWSVGTHVLKQTALDGSSVLWDAIILDLSDRERIHHAIVDDPRSTAAIKAVVDEK